MTHFITSVLSRLAQGLDSTLHIGERWEKTRSYARKRPKTAMFLTSVIALLVVPVAVFLGVVVSSFVASLTMLLCIQGTILTISTIILMPILAISLSFAIGITIIGTSVNYVMSLVYSACSGTSEAVRPYLRESYSTLTKLKMPKKMVTRPTMNYKVYKHSEVVSGTTSEPTTGGIVMAQGDYPRVRANFVRDPANAAAVTTAPSTALPPSSDEEDMEEAPAGYDRVLHED